MMRVALGIGCRAGRPAEAIEAAIRAALARLPQASLADVGVVATLDAKAREPGLVACCARHGWPLVAFSRDEIAAHLARLAGLARAGSDSGSDSGSGSGSGVGASPAPGAPPCAAARARFGVDGVCEPCACLAAPNGALIVRKLALDGVTAALAGPL
ncbi:cobalamin biosynthesis protein CbiG [Burkholderia pseudomallei]|uniref:cobalamin biosynthesis protein n=1 Tax=Burkholderia pseudomallei TaxID=28450 RepID=UPI0009785957|nr:cobalamin biosynthesis protein [Burkholderia pseudomallei]ONC30326.1 cobalamin biosynthesis protein CbiG [Burkholderia pseudomallei]